MSNYWIRIVGNHASSHLVDFAHDEIDKHCARLDLLALNLFDFDFAHDEKDKHGAHLDLLALNLFD